MSGGWIDPHSLIFVPINQDYRVPSNHGSLNPSTFYRTFAVNGKHMVFQPPQATGLKLKYSKQITEEAFHRYGGADFAKIYCYQDPNSGEHGYLAWFQDGELKRIEEAGIIHRVLRRKEGVWIQANRISVSESERRMREDIRKWSRK